MGSPRATENRDRSTIAGIGSTSAISSTGAAIAAPVCRGCGLPILDAKRSTRVYHSQACRRLPAPTARVCASCGGPIVGRKATARTCSDACSQTLAANRRVYHRPFVALDGEGETRKESNEHIYTLLADSNGNYIGSKKNGLSTEECLDFLVNRPRGSNSGTKPIYVWFSFDYDVNMMLGDIPLKGENSIDQLRKTNRIYWRGFHIHYLRRKILRIRYGDKIHTSYDVWGFFQSSFEKALTDWNIEVPAIITEGKAARGDFTRWTLRRIREYNHAELTQLAQLCERLRDAVTPLDLPIQSWHGPAALAAAWLRKNRIKEWKTDDIPEGLFEAATRAYFGGRIDVLGYGIVEPVYHYDIVSAYPAAIAGLPKLTNIKWKRHGKGLPPAGGLYAARISWDIPEAYWAPLPWRAGNGSIRYPLAGEGWYWMHEVEAAIKKHGSQYFKCSESWRAEGDIEYPFRELVHSTFQYRKALKRDGKASHVAVKLVLNSLYGKFAQTVGKPQYYSPIWAGLITSHTRARLMEAITDDVVCVMTDSIWSSKPITVPIGGSLGEWEEGNETRLVLAEAGLYQASDSSGSLSTWQRGFDKRNPVDIERLVSEWLDGDPLFSPSYSVLRFIGMGLGCITSYPWRQWVEIPRRIEPVPFAGTTKRLPRFPSINPDDSNDTREGSFVKLRLRARDTDTLSAPYSKLTTDMQVVMERLEDECEE